MNTIQVKVGDFVKANYMFGCVTGLVKRVNKHVVVVDQYRDGKVYTPMNKELRITISRIYEINPKDWAAPKPQVLEHELYVSPMKEDNIAKYGESSDMCECCGKKMKVGETKSVHMSTNWMAMDNSIKTEEDAIKHGLQSQGYFNIGNSCAKKMPKNFIHN